MVTRTESVTTTAKQIATYNAKRKSLVITNTSTDAVYIAEDHDGVTSKGFPLNQNDVIGFTARDGDQPELQLFAQTSSGTSDLRIVERFGDSEKVSVE